MLVQNRGEYSDLSLASAIGMSLVFRPRPGLDLSGTGTGT